MFDKELAIELLEQIHERLYKIRERTKTIHSADYFINSSEGELIFDSICMLFIAIGENLKRFDKISAHDNQRYIKTIK